jgi:hypothetical protein
MDYNDEKHVLKLAFGWIAAIGFGLALAITIVVGAVAGFNAVTAGPKDDLRHDLSYACSQQFDAAQFPPECVTFVSGK